MTKTKDKNQKILIITEKKSVAETIAKALGKPKKKQDYFEVDNYIITWAQGHLFTLAEPEKYNKQLKMWKLMTLPIVPKTFKLEPIKGSAEKRIKAIKNLLNKVDTVINAMDAGREGELIFRYIKQSLNIKQPVKRLWLQAMTKKAIIDALDNLKDESEMENLGQAAEARSEADWLVGINSTRAITIVGKELFSIGRVQTPTLAIIVDREKEIQNFKPIPYWRIKAILEKDKGTIIAWHIGDKGDGKLWDKDKAEKIYATVQNISDARVYEVKSTKKKKNPPLPFRLATFQRVASQLFGWTAKQSLNYLQTLYEEGLITYPRTDSDHLPTAMKSEVKKLAHSLSSIFPELDDSRISPRYRPSLFDDTRVSDHYAIIPTGKKPDSNLSNNLIKAFELVSRRFFAAFYPAAEYEIQNVSISINEETFKTTLSTLMKPGYLTIYFYDVFSIKSSFIDYQPGHIKDKNSYYNYMKKLQSTPDLKKGDILNVKSIELEEKETKPPSRYTDGTLIKLMETAGRDIEDEKLKDIMKGKGLGTPATRAAIIETLIQRGYVERTGKTLKATPKGIKLIETLRDIGLKTLTEPLLTGEWEYRLRLIEEGKKKKAEFIKEVTTLTREIIQTIRGKDFSKIRDTLIQGTQRDSIIGKCPICGGNVIVKAKGYFCENTLKNPPTCTFKIFKNTYGGNITIEVARELLEHKKTSKPVKLYSKGKKKHYKAHLVLTENGRVVPEFITENQNTEEQLVVQTSEEPIGKCPICGKDVVKTSNGFACIGALENPPACSFVVNKNIFGGNITDEIMKELLEKKETTRKIKLYSRGKKKVYYAKLVVTEDGKIVPEFVTGRPSKT